ncbi:hypothetical protein P7K49_002412 [Saguinus oedipus]|uniref:Uncharacterized protein n=1 Tax=Saguinus oedipus TaxID=9490 RepID=A0ABQ9WI93_SAGOE|nr:hypothetical protein P7K49_002412 [Saguinus oedipus]
MGWANQGLQVLLEAGHCDNSRIQPPPQGLALSLRAWDPSWSFEEGGSSFRDGPSAGESAGWEVEAAAATAAPTCGEVSPAQGEDPAFPAQPRERTRPSPPTAFPAQPRKRTRPSPPTAFPAQPKKRTPPSPPSRTVQRAWERTPPLEARTQVPGWAVVVSAVWHQ